jgi:hypothetical protein
MNQISIGLFADDTRYTYGQNIYVSYGSLVRKSPVHVPQRKSQSPSCSRDVLVAGSYRQSKSIIYCLGNNVNVG